VVSQPAAAARGADARRAAGLRRHDTGWRRPTPHLHAHGLIRHAKVTAAQPAAHSKEARRARTHGWLHGRVHGCGLWLAAGVGA
jgi:hypothetical protein